MVRFLVAVLGFLSAFIAPWWMPFVFMAALSLRFRAWEVPLIGLATDLLWLPGAGIPVGLIAGLVLAWGAEPIRARFLA